MTEPLLRLRLGERVAWARDLDIAIPAGLAATLDDRSRTAAAHQALHLRAAFTNSPPSSSRLPFSYQSVPSWIRSLVAMAIGRMRRRQVARWADFPGWPLDLSADALADLAGLAPSAFATGPTPVLLSHDLDSLEGLRNLVGHFLAVEEAGGARSSSYIVPCAWPVDHGLMAETQRRGHELGIHGYDHGNRTPFCENAEMRHRVEAARPLVERYGMIGYRAPSLLRTRPLLGELSRLYRYDSSIPTSGGLFPMPNNGCASARPFRLQGLWEIPLSMPRDGSLRFLGHSAREILAIWRGCAGLIAASGGVVMLLTHCEQRFSGNPVMLDAYRGFLEWVAGDGRFAFSTPAAVLERMERTQPVCT